MVLAAVFLTACGGGGAKVTVPDGGDAGGRDAPGESAASSDAQSDHAAADVADATSVTDVTSMPDDAGQGEVGQDASMEMPVEVNPDVAPPKVDAGPDLKVDMKVDLPAEKPPAAASWTIAPGPTCTAAGVGCMDTGAIGGYQVTASGVCGGPSSVQLWFPGSQAAVAPGTYSVKLASGILDVINMQAGMVGVLAERNEGSTHARYWGRSGTATVTVAGAGRRITLAGVSLREETSGAMTTLAVEGTCP
jgi:hypothetical protein